MGFTSSLLETLKVSRSKVDAFVDAQKAGIDSQVIAHNKRVSQEQALIDEQAKNLTTLQLERGLSAANANPVEGLVQRREELFSQQNTLKEQINKLGDERAKRQKDLEGKISRYTVTLFPVHGNRRQLISNTILSRNQNCRSGRRSINLGPRKQER
jgi:hypothetical protein